MLCWFSVLHYTDNNRDSAMHFESLCYINYWDYWDYLFFFFSRWNKNSSAARWTEDSHSFNVGMILQALHLQRQHQAYHLPNKHLFILSYRPNKLGFCRIEFSAFHLYAPWKLIHTYLHIVIQFLDNEWPFHPYLCVCVFVNSLGELVLGIQKS